MEGAGQLWSEGTDCPCCLPRGEGGPWTQPVWIRPTWSMPSAATWSDRRGRRLWHRSWGEGVTQADGTGAAWEGALCRARRKASPSGKEAPEAKSALGGSYSARRAAGRDAAAGPRGAKKVAESTRVCCQLWASRSL